jgi:hypothetical protein
LRSALAGVLLAVRAPLAGVLLGAAGLIAHADPADDALIASGLVNFLRFFEWPAAAQGTLTFCFLGADSVREKLTSEPEQQHVGAWTVVMRAASDVDDISSCSVLYIDASWRRANPAISEPIRKHMLTISDSSDFNARGGMIEIMPLSDHLRFSVDLPNIRRAGLHVSSTLLEIATVRH